MTPRQFKRDGWRETAPGRCACPDCGEHVSSNALARHAHRRACAKRAAEDRGAVVAVLARFMAADGGLVSEVVSDEAVAEIVRTLATQAAGRRRLREMTAISRERATASGAAAADPKPARRKRGKKVDPAPAFPRELTINGETYIFKRGLK